MPEFKIKIDSADVKKEAEAIFEDGKELIEEAVTSMKKRFDKFFENDFVFKMSIKKKK